jgi:hypothetical protein
MRTFARNSYLTPRRTGTCERCWSGCWGRRAAKRSSVSGHLLPKLGTPGGHIPRGFRARPSSNTLIEVTTMPLTT